MRSGWGTNVGKCGAKGNFAKFITSNRQKNADFSVKITILAEN